ncbi:RagB/SusD family nutrient uptake outer membrane protein [Daejeonella lutea]|uniref:Starch-binding associating with outer membrane n=1 Tax=Daejeonella lutea TaxID=572036 RepID=A0A1T5DWX9_9SPHI|nr:RagB/SusD family nutrient uptake outer membrane protein [Daejeonella lutea]SKB75963.1 Starch-binding associating with outer membrane [Daejeonella lutea]
MKYQLRFIYGVVAALILVSSCNKDVLDRPQLNDPTDDTFWQNETDIRLFANGYYTNYFNGYSSGFGVDYVPVRGYTFSDDLTSRNQQAAFENAVPASRSSTSETAAWLGSQFAGPTWNFSWVRKTNVFLDRLETVTKPKLTPEAYNHWSGVARFFRGYEYSRLVSVFGDVPYFDKVVKETELEILFKDRDNRGVVMDKVYDDFKYALANIRINDGKQYLNRYIAAGFISRFMLFEGTFQHYHNLDAARAKKYLELAAEAAQLVINSNAYNFGSDFKAIFSSDNLNGNPEVMLYRTYDAALGVTHSIGSYNNGTEVNGGDANLDLVKSFIVNDGKPWQNSTVAKANSFSIPDLALTRDPRFEATFIDRAHTPATTLLYGYKFASREAITFIGKAYPAMWGSSTNTSDAPVMRLAEVVLNWIEAKAVLAQHFAGPAITQGDIDKSINAIRSRPLDAAAIAKGVKKTSPLLLAALPVDPARDTDVPALIWEIRRERRMEFVYEHTRLLDLKRWKKLRYMDYSTKNDYLMGPWVNIPVEAPALLGTSFINRTRVRKEDGTVVTFNGTNQSAMVGYFMVEGATNRNAFTDKSYTAPVGQAQIAEYQSNGFKLTQTTGW